MKNLSLRKKFSGTYTALITPYTQYNTVDYSSLEKIVEEQVEAGIEGVVVTGTTGESPTMNWDEHNNIIKFVVEKVAGRIKVVAGTGSNYTIEAIDGSIAAEHDGVDAILVVTPYYNKPTQKGIFQYFSEICSAVKIPVIAYNIEGRSGVNIETTTLKKIANNNPNLIGVKEASGKIDQAVEVRKELGEDFLILSGDDTLTLEMIEKAGADGSISVLSNIMPQEVKSLTEKSLQKDFRAAKGIYNNLETKMKMCFIETNPIPIKTLMAAAGKCQELFRSPLCTMEEKNKEQLLQEFSFIKNI